MKRNHFIYFIPFILLAIMVTGCAKTNKEDTCLSYEVSPVTSITGPGTATVNQEVLLTVSFGCFNGCGQFGSFGETTSGNITSVTVTAKYQGCVCTMDAPIRQVPYKFKRSVPGTYTLRFFQAHSTYLDHSIVVQ